jgi:hypothetical protein
VSHDIWESRNGHWLGVTLFLVDVTSWEMLSFPIGFCPSKGKKAKKIFQQVNNRFNKAFPKFKVRQKNNQS